MSVGETRLLSLVGKRGERSCEQEGNTRALRTALFIVP